MPPDRLAYRKTATASTSPIPTLREATPRLPLPILPSAPCHRQKFLGNLFLYRHNREPIAPSNYP
jgi:hypothetical protein